MNRNVGSTWKRWDPHLHCPGTLLNDGFGNDWDGYVKSIESAAPPVVALGITDYWTLRGYKEVLKRRDAGALENVPLIFANVELRLTIETKRKKGINLHLLVSPDDPDHVARMEEHLARLGFEYAGERYPCTDEGLRRLGRDHKGDKNLPDEAALKEGALQFKVDLDPIRGLFKDDWVRANVLVAVAAGEDGLSGLSEDAGFHAQRIELGRFADIIFSSSPNDRNYWCGLDGKLKKDGLDPRPCLHGSDAHDVAKVLDSFSPESGVDRRCWIRAEPRFDGLRQTLVEPERRVCIGPLPQPGPSAGETVRCLKLKGAQWFEGGGVEFNDGLVTVIGARGSGKTALAELLAVAAGAADEMPGPASFIKKAGSLVATVEAGIEWGDGSSTSAVVGAAPEPKEPRVRYLSQQFVETLCSASIGSSGHDEPLQREIEAVVFEAIPEEDRLRCADFVELRDARTDGCLRREESERANISGITAQIAAQHELTKTLPAIKVRLAESERALKSLESDLTNIPLKATDGAVKAQADVGKKLSELRDAIALAQRLEQSLRDLHAEWQRHVAGAHDDWETLKARYTALLSNDQWSTLRPKVDSQAEPMLMQLVGNARTRVEALRLLGLPGRSSDDGIQKLEETNRSLTAALGLDQANARKRTDIEKRIVVAKQAVASAKEEETKAAAASDKRKELSEKRFACYERVFEAFDEHVEALKVLYGPLQTRLQTDARLKRLTLVVERVVDLQGWADRGERLFDLRSAPFGGHGELKQQAETVLIDAWAHHTPTQVRKAMESFTATVLQQPHSLGVSPAQIGEWLFSTDHIHVRYAIQYDGLSLNRLSPGARGVVLLTLYLALDGWDRRPLIIDQPEENLDPRSIYEDLVPFFRDAACRRQVIMVTHNANLVVNTDSDQVIIADANRVDPEALPNFAYNSGGLEDASICRDVCQLLEGGSDAFERRRKRYRSS